VVGCGEIVLSETAAIKVVDSLFLTTLFQLRMLRSLEWWHNYE
jgi:hypothetical protein